MKNTHCQRRSLTKGFQSITNIQRLHMYLVQLHENATSTVHVRTLKAENPNTYPTSCLVASVEAAW